LTADDNPTALPRSRCKVSSGFAFRHRIILHHEGEWLLTAIPFLWFNYHVAKIRRQAANSLHDLSGCLV
jgi:hypothetical protein